MARASGLSQSISQARSNIDSEIDALLHTPFAHLLGTNHNVTSSINQHQLCELVESLSSGVDEIDAIIKHLSQSKVRMQHAKKEHSRFLSVVIRVPDDVLSIIFKYVSRSYQIPVPPISLSRVCRRWRTVALADPKLWNSIHITAGSKRASSRCAEMISRSRLLPTHLFIHGVNTESMKAMEQNGVLAGLRDTCKGLQLSYNSRRTWAESVSFGELDNWLAQHFPNLESLSLLDCYLATWRFTNEEYDDSEVENDDVTGSPDIYRALSRLRNLHIEVAEENNPYRDPYRYEEEDGEEECQLLDFRRVFPFHFSNLRRLIVNHVAEDSFIVLDIVKFSVDFPNLEEFYLVSSRFSSSDITARTEPPVAAQGTARLPHLRLLSLQLEWDHPAYLIDTFHALTLPSLTDLTFSFTYQTHGSEQEIRAVEACLSRSQCPLRRLYIDTPRAKPWIDKWAIRLKETYPCLQVDAGESWRDFNHVKKSWYY
ncbi:hypothetical protein CONPUDRAFT_150413 [Coniophora puteana RWD-64-598 SS2]|uniref:F-box domain-containing protein n=1 Tax=Coniophora puteana (strain RWD-64-598) TaxID=741705 RepID=A0A5M3N2K9_CONPW|nr:uncharacterized protein CONPUDRAFT_150413 [Coniophora puteana RWD-64-598 SS2]EIW85608.1 hypothetical protein CONPUDRAFT_150413 [Coniophora puteana RWD-64-598 SS2]